MTGEHMVERLLEIDKSAFYPESTQLTKANLARQMLGAAVSEMNDDQLEILVSQCEYLIDCWLDEYERNLLGGKTLKETLNI
jgi:hypothetical protein